MRVGILVACLAATLASCSEATPELSTAAPLPLEDYVARLVAADAAFQTELVAAVEMDSSDDVDDGFRMMGGALGRYSLAVGEAGPPSEIAKSHLRFHNGLEKRARFMFDTADQVMTAIAAQQEPFFDWFDATNADTKSYLESACEDLESAIRAQGIDVDLDCLGFG